MPSDRAISVIGDLIAFDTTSHLSNLALIDHVKDYLTSLGIDSQIIRNTAGDKANLYATIGPADRPGIILSGHTDVVPARAEEWSSDPFILNERNGKYYGRGSADMKGFIGLVLAMLPEFLARDLRMPIHVALSHDEEVGCLGVHGLLDVLETLPTRPAMCIIGEPTGMQVAVGHKGTRCYRAIFTGLEAHSSLAPKGVNAIEYAARLVDFLRRMRERFAERGPFDEAFDITHCTVHPGVIVGGKAVNIVPSHCSLDFEFRHLAEQDPDAIFAEIEAFARQELEPAMRAVDPGTGILFDTVYAYPGLNTGGDAGVVAFVKALAGRNDHIKIAFGTEGGLFDQLLGIPTVVCGPGYIAQAHQPDEFISAEQLDAAEHFLKRLLAELTVR